MVKYTKGHVGIMRHPELYTKPYVPVFEDVETELAMWKAAEKMSTIITKGKFDKRQLMFIIHYLMNLQGMDDEEMYKEHQWMAFKITQSVITQNIRELLGNSARQIVKSEQKVKKDKDERPMRV